MRSGRAPFRFTEQQRAGLRIEMRAWIADEHIDDFIARLERHVDFALRHLFRPRDEVAARRGAARARRELTRVAAASRKLAADMASPLVKNLLLFSPVAFDADDREGPARMFREQDEAYARRLEQLELDAGRLDEWAAKLARGRGAPVDRAKRVFIDRFLAPLWREFSTRKASRAKNTAFNALCQWLGENVPQLRLARARPARTNRARARELNR